MKQVIMSLGVAASLSACTVVPVPVAVIQPKTTTVAEYQTLPNALPVSYQPQINQPPAINMAVATTAESLIASKRERPVIATNPQAIKVYQPTVLPKTPIKDLAWVAEKIYQNETGNKPENLIRWHETGNFVSLGIGHFSWYPNNRRGYTQNDTFPELLSYMQLRGVTLPTWLAKRPTRGGPWKNKSAFDMARNDKQMQELQQLLQTTKNLQANFMLEHLKQARPELLGQFNATEQATIDKNYQTLLQTPNGLYPLLDYVSFKGEGLNPNDRYNGQGWGLAQVLLTMQPTAAGPRALEAFRVAAEDVLLQRIANAPTERREARYLSSWRERLNTYYNNANVATR
jgi:hypothetical protein